MKPRIVTDPNEIIDALKRGAKIELNTGIYWRRSVMYDPDYWIEVLKTNTVRITENAPAKEHTISWGWIVFWMLLISYVSFSSGEQLARRNVKADTAHIRDVCLITGDVPCIERALKRIEESTP